MKSKSSNINRRDFLKVLGGSAAVVAVASCSDKAARQIVGSGKEPGQMTYRQSPQGEKVSLLGYGCMRWPTSEPDENGQKTIDQEAVNAMVDYAIEHGVTYFDTAPIYVQGKSETSTGIALKRHPRESFTIATKLSNQRGEPTFERSIKMYKASFENLQVDYIDYYLLHSIGGGKDPMETLNKRFFDNGVLDFLVKEREAGRIRNLGWSFHGDVKVFDYMLSLHDEGKYHWDFVQIQMNYIDWKHAHERDEEEVNAEYLYTELEKRGIPVVIMEPLLGGSLASLNDDCADKLLARKPYESIASWAFRFCGSHPGVLTVLSGMTYMEHLEDNIRTYSPLEPLTEEEQRWLDGETATLLESYPTIHCTSCKYCMPCPYGLNIPSIFQYYNKCVNKGNVPESQQAANYEQARKAFLVGYDRAVPKLRQADHCIGCRQCVSHCPQQLDIPNLLKRVDEFVEKLKQNTL